ncbi:methyl-accepting chemotaxis protein [Aneurinibacillus sp. Ricciae_BoGa-3]|uniref:methyl-accepting chemotaxis protein n=1 Tax=Aneurinibacillus sp. Ricciae_BoGa-3 TaxID=3022697 RepID=UPI002341A2F1|nr:methyl-accepting chemotaxis protein [Aneurinibacillus sp. Ricciae_BoGa-3]WCK55590.1 methyl-accepting chemotaxis protein [Aneurinibacillus sp. Ricciae_BoGa-3]
MKTLRSKLLFLMIPIFVISLTMIAYINHNKAKDFLKQNFQQDAQGKLDFIQKSVDEWIQSKQDVIHTMALSEEAANPNLQIEHSYLLKQLGAHSEFEMLFVSSDTIGNRTLTSTGQSMDISSRPYFKESLNGKTVITDPLISKVSGKLAVVVSAPLYKEKKVAGVIGGTILVDKLVQVVNSQKLGQSGYAYMFNSQGIVIAHPKHDYILKLNLHTLGSKELSDAINRTIHGETGLIEYTFEGVDKYAFYKKSAKTDWGIIITSPVNEATSQMSYLAKLSFVTALIVLIFTILALVVFASRLVRPIHQLSMLTQGIAQGDLTLKTNIYTKDEVGDLSRYFNDMVDSMQSIILNVKEASKRLKASSETLEITSRETKDSSEQVAVTISELANGTTDISMSIQEIANEVADMIATIGHVNKIAASMLDIFKRSQEESRKGQEDAAATIQKMSEINHNTEQNVVRMRTLGEKTNEVHEIVQLITNIASQTNLLALNASIEAARAGESGKGFAVVAGEVRKLAEETSAAALNIQQIVMETMAQTQSAIRSIELGQAEISEGAQLVHTTGMSFTTINQSIVQAVNQAHDLVRSMDILEKKSGLVGENIETIAAITEEASAGAQEVSAVCEEQAAASHQIAADAGTLSELARELQNLTSQFKTQHTDAE